MIVVKNGKIEKYDVDASKGIAEYKKIDERIEEYPITIPAEYDEQGNLLSEEHEEVRTHTVPVMGIVYRDMTEEEEEEVSRMSSLDNSARIDELKQKLAETDYIARKIAEGSATVEEYAEQIKQRQLWREQINELENVKNEVIENGYD